MISGRRRRWPLLDPGKESLSWRSVFCVIGHEVFRTVLVGPKCHHRASKHAIDRPLRLYARASDHNDWLTRLIDRRNPHLIFRQIRDDISGLLWVEMQRPPVDRDLA
jgi:hypothetical protein